MKEKLDFVNVSEDAFPLWEYCKAEGWTDCTLEEFEMDGVLQFFEGDPDMVKVDGETGYFFRNGNTVFVYVECWHFGRAKEILQGFFDAFETWVSPGGYHGMRGKPPAGVVESTEENGGGAWDWWEAREDGIAWRGGAGYVYELQDWTAWKGGAE